MIQGLITALILSLALSVGSVSHAKLTIPQGLTSSDETQIMHILGAPTSPKILGNPYALGGYAGVEISVSDEIIPAKDLATLGLGTSEEDTTNYYLINIGKGLYQNVDVFFQATPFIQAEGITNYGGQIRWMFYESEKMPLYVSVMAGANGVNIQNLVTLTSVVFDVIAGYNVNHISAYLVAGTVHSNGQFAGGTLVDFNGNQTCPSPNAGVTASCLSEASAISSNHFGAGVSFSYDIYFLALEYDKYFDSTMAFKLGTRF